MKKLLWRIYACIVLIFFACSSLQAGSITPELESRLQSHSPEDEIAVIITLRDQVDISLFKDKNRGLLKDKGKDKSLYRSKFNRALRDKADKSQRPLKQFLKRKGARKIKSFWIFNGMAMTLKVKVVEELARQLGIESIRLDGIINPPVPLGASSATPEWNINAINAPSLWAKGYTGAGVVIAGMDTGVDLQHQDLFSRWRGGSNSWFDIHGEHPLTPNTPYDFSGHGTQSMGIMVGGDAGGSAIGVAPGASWIAVKLFSNSKITLDSHVHAGFQWLLDPDGDPDTDDLPDVVNNSWGYDTLVNQCFSEFEADILALKSAGVAVVFSAGNSGPNSSTSISPANYAKSFATGSVNEQLQLDLTSSRGPSACGGTIFPEIVAPGVDIWTADLTLSGTQPYSYASVSGTSFAAPHVSGSMALLLSAKPQLTVDELETAIISSATNLGDVGPDYDYGYGLLDVAASYNLLTPFPWLLFMPVLTR